MRHLRQFTRDHVGNNADHANRSHAHHRQRERIVARENAKIAVNKSAQLADAIHDACRLFQSNDMLRQIAPQPRNRVVRDVHTAAPGNIVQNKWNIRLLRNCAEVRVESGLCRLL